MNKYIKIVVFVLISFIVIEVFCKSVGGSEEGICHPCPPFCGGEAICHCETNFCYTNNNRFFCEKNVCMTDKKGCEKNKNNLIKCNSSADCAGCKPGEEYPILKCDKNKQCKLTYECGKSNCKSNSDCCSSGETYPYYACDYNLSQCITKYECGKSTCKLSDNYTKNWKGETIEKPNSACITNPSLTTTTTTSVTTTTTTTTLYPPTSTSTSTSFTSTSTSTTRRSTSSSTTSTTSEPGTEPVPEVCRVNDFDITPHLASLLALSDKRSYFIADWGTSNCNSCELGYLPVDADGKPLRDKYGIKQTEYIKSASNLPTSSPDPAYDSDYKYDKDPSNLYVIKNYPQKGGHYLYQLICEGPDNQDESFPVHIFVAPWMIGYEVPPVMPTSKFHTIITSPGGGQSIEEYKGY